MVADALSRMSMGSVADVAIDKKDVTLRKFHNLH